MWSCAVSTSSSLTCVCTPPIVTGKHDLNVEKVAKSVYNNAKTLKQLTNLEASVLMDKITSYQREKSIPEELLGYDPSWQSSF